MERPQLERSTRRRVLQGRFVEGAGGGAGHGERYVLERMGEGTQIEPAEDVHYRDGREYPKRYRDYGNDGPYKYINMTAAFSKLFKAAIATGEPSDL